MSKEQKEQIINQTIPVNLANDCVHDYIKDFGITRCGKCKFKYIMYLKPLKIK